MEIINGYGASMSLGTTVFDNVTTETSSYSLTSNIHFFSGEFDPTTLYNYTTTSSMLSVYASQYLGSVNSVPMTITYNDATKKRVIKQTSPNALRFKDPRYINTTYALGTAFTKPAIGTKYKFKFDNSTVKDGFLLNGVNVNTTYNENMGGSKSHILASNVDGFDELFLGGYSVGGGTIDFINNTIYGYRVDGSTSKGYRSVTMQDMINKGYSKIVVVNNSSTCGIGFLGYDWNDTVLLDNYNYNISSATYEIDFINMTASVTASYNRVNSTANLKNYDLSRLKLGVYATQAGDGWQYWNVTLYKKPNVYMIESDFFTTTENITITNPNALTHSGFEVIPYGDDDKPLSNQITWCAIDIGSNRIIYTDDIGVRDNPSFINLNSLTSTYGTDNIVNSIKIEYRNKSQGEIL